MAEPIPAVSIIVVSYNSRQMTLECLRSVVAETEIPYDPLGLWLFRMVPLSRHVTLSLVAALTRHPSARESAEFWGEVWARRAEWQDGLPESPVPVTSSK
jgi:hypothetical protein